MKRIRVAIVQEMEVPDDWDVLKMGENERTQFLLSADGRLLVPDIEWLEFNPEAEEGSEYTRFDLDDEFANSLVARITAQTSIIGG